MASEDSSQFEPRTIDEKGNPPKERICTYGGLWRSYQDSIEADKVNDARATSLLGIYARKAPQNPAELREQGLEDMPNFNTGEFTAKVDSYVSTLIDHNTGGYKIATVKLKRKPENPPELSDYYDEKATDFFNEAFTEWDDDSEVRGLSAYLMNTTVRDTQMGIFGIGLSYHKDDVDWRFSLLPTRKFRVPRGTKADLSNCPAAFIETSERVTDLYDKVEKAPDGSGWNKEAVFRLLYERTSSRNSSGDVETFAEWENRRRNSDVFIRECFEMVELVDCYVDEFRYSGKRGVSHYIIPRGTAPQEILFRKARRYTSFRSFVHPFYDNPGPEGDYHGVRGFGDSVFDQCHFQNQFFNQMARSALIGNMPMFSANSEAERDKLAQVKWTNLGILNPGLTLTQVNVHTDLSGMMGVYSASQRMLNTNSRTYQPGESLGQQAKTATQSTFDRQDQAKLSSLQIKSYRMCLDPLFAEMYRRLTRKSYPRVAPGGRAAESFHKKCEEAGIPEECYTKPIEVIADRTGGTGNQALDLMIAKELMGIASPGRGQLNARREIAKALKGTDRVEEFVQSEETPQEEQGYVDLENSNLADGQSFPARPNQEHLLHLGQLSADGEGHLGVLLTTYQVASEMAKQGGVEQSIQDAQKLDRVLEAALTHVAQHVQFLGQFGIKQYQEIAKELQKTLNDMGQFLITFRQQIADAMQAQQPAQPQLSADDQAKLIRAQVEAEIMRAKAMQEMELKRMDAISKIQNMNDRAVAKDALKEQEFQIAQDRKEREFNQQMGHQAVQTLTNQQIALAEAQTKAQNNVKQAEQTE